MTITELKKKGNRNSNPVMLFICCLSDWVINHPFGDAEHA